MWTFSFGLSAPREAPVLRGFTADEIAIMNEIRWWSVEEIEGSTERIFPVDLALRVRGVCGSA